MRKKPKEPLLSDNTERQTKRNSKQQPRQKQTAKRAKSDWHFDHVVEHASAGQMDRIWDAFIDAVEKEKLFCGGGMHPAGGCAWCRDEDET